MDWGWIPLGLAAVGLLLYQIRKPSLERELAKARSSGQIDPLLARILGQATAAQPNSFNRVIKRLWDDYRRELALPLIRALAEHHTETQIAQYWLNQLQRVEPELAREGLGSSFFRTHFRPDVAATCGEFG